MTQKDIEISNTSMTVFSAALLALPVTFYYYLANGNLSLFPLYLVLLNFVLFIISGIFGVIKRVRTINYIETDLIQKISTVYRVKKIDYNKYELRKQTDGSILEGIYSIDLTKAPTDRFEIDHTLRLIKYKQIPK